MLEQQYFELIYVTIFDFSKDLSWFNFRWANS